MQLAERTAEIARLLQERNWRALRELLAHLPPPEGAELLFRLQKPERMLVFRSMPRDLAAEVFRLRWWSRSRWWRWCSSAA